MSFIIGIPLLIFVAILQTTVVSRMPLLNGSADLMLVVLTAWALQPQVETTWQWSMLGGLLMDYFSGLPFGLYTISYLLLSGAGILLRRRVWRFSYLMHLLLTLAGTLIIHGLSVMIILLQGTPLQLRYLLQRTTLPSLLLNLILTFPVYLLMKDIAQQLHTEAVEL